MSAAKLRLPPLPTIKDLVRLYKLRAIKQLSQNFLMDENLTNKIVRAAGNVKNCYVLEVGPGPGGITRSILYKSPKKLIVVEKDPRFIPTLELLQEACGASTKMDIEINDIRSYDFHKGFIDAPNMDWYHSIPPIHLIGNLPFSVSTNLIIRWLESISKKTGAWSFGRTPMTLTFQKEVAERMIAPVGHKQRCRLSVMCQTWCHVYYKFTIPGKAFVPKPDVDVGVVTFYPRKYPLNNLPFKLVEKVIRQIFNLRQKYSIRGAETLFPEDLRPLLGKLLMYISSLFTIVNFLGPKLFHLADIDPQIRPFQISNEEYARLCYAYKALVEEYPYIELYDFRQPMKSIAQ